MSPSPSADARAYVAGEVAERSRHATAEEVRTTCSFARAERLLGREYHGRFLIELLQNAADAWRNDPRSAAERSRVAVIVAEGPVLLVANQGAAMTADVVIESLGHIGASTKSEGEAIGHKGIGFKSVLEVTLAPEIYSGLQAQEPGLAVCFDPELAKASILRESREWHDLLAGVQGLDPDDDLAAVPILRFPQWVDHPPPDVAQLAAEGFDTVVRLPFDLRFSERLGLDEGRWLATVRDALADVSDQILLLLGCFAEVRVEDRTSSTAVNIRPEWNTASTVAAVGPSCEDVRILRDGQVSSRWRLFRQTLPSLEHLAGEIAVGMRLSDAEGSRALLPATDGAASAPFYLFFPTRIGSGLPFLLHGYFEVDAARTGFYRGSTSRNEAILDQLAALVAVAISDAAKQPSIDLVSVVDLVAAAAEPEDPLARNFRNEVLQRLDEVAWVPLEGEIGDATRAQPDQIFVGRPELTRHVANVFPPSYVSARVQLGLPDVRLSDAALELVASRQPKDRPDEWEVIAELSRPGPLTVWDDDAADRGFRSLLDLLDALGVSDQAATTALIDGLRGDPHSRLLPSAGPSGGRQLLPVPDPTEGVPGRRSRLVMARARVTSGEPLVPPEELDLAFLPEGLLPSESDIDRAKPLGVRPFTVDNVLDRLNGISESTVDVESLLRFLWRLLTRERASGFGTRRSAERAAVFDPKQWFWCRPGRAREDETSRLRQQRERYLADVPVPCRDGEWRRAGTVAFGADWAEWLEAGTAGSASSAAARQRAAAYRTLESVSPGPEALLAPPHVVLNLLGGESFDEPLVLTEDEEPEEVLDEAKKNAERHAFLLRLGVWEVPPIEAFENRERANREKFPWTGPVADLQQTAIADAGGWRFGLEGWAGNEHHNVYLAEDYRFLWSLEEMASRGAHGVATGLQAGVGLYSERLAAAVFCPQCRDRDSGGSHAATRQSTATSGYPSWLALQLGQDRWVACTLDGEPVDRALAAVDAWWHPKPPTGSGLRQSPWRLVPLCGPATGVSDELRRLAGANTLEDASIGTLRSLLGRLRSDYEAQALVVDPVSSGSARQAFVGMHRLIYERLADLVSEHADDVAKVLADVGMLCELGDGLVYRAPREARHDDGRFSAYVRHFVGAVPFVVLPRDHEVRAARLGVQPFVVRLARRGDDGADVTDDLRGLISDRIPELLAIVVNHSLGTQTLELSSLQFEERARRLQAMTVRQTNDLVIDASIDDSTFKVTLGEGSDEDLFLENPTSTSPILFHDMSGEGWQDRLRRKIAPHLATVLENAAYSHTFALFLQAETDADREEFLIELGISGDEVDAVAARIGVVGQEERQRHLRWFTAVLRAVEQEAQSLELEHSALVAALTEAGFPAEVARALAEAGGGEGVRRDAGEDSPLRLLDSLGVDLAFLDAELRKAGDPGLALSVTRRAFARWIEANGRRVSAVLASSLSPDAAKAAVRMLEPPPDLALSIDPPAKDLLLPVVELLHSAGFEVDAVDLAEDPLEQLVRAGPFASAALLDEQVLLLFDEEEQRRALRERAAHWRREIRVLAVLSRMGPAATRATVRAIDDAVRGTLPGAPAAPSDLLEAVATLFVEHAQLADGLALQLVDSFTSEIPQRDELLALAKECGVAVERLPVLERALEAPRRDHARAIKNRSDRLSGQGIVPAPPKGLKPPPVSGRPGASGPKKVSAVKVGESHDRRKRELGDEGEQWALAAVVGQILPLSIDERNRAIDGIVDLFARFEGVPVDAALAHAELARSRELDEEELIDELTGLLHVSRHSDAFGFDLVGWLPLAPGSEPNARCLEVKSSGGEAFNLSTAEWALAQRLSDESAGDRYAVLVVRRGKRGGLPSSMDLLADPVSLVASGQLRREVDGYKIAYRTNPLDLSGAHRGTD